MLQYIITKEEFEEEQESEEQIISGKLKSPRKRIDSCEVARLER